MNPKKDPTPDANNLPNGRFWRGLTELGIRFDWLFVIVSVVSIAISLNYVRKIEIRSDFKEMLPEDFKSVIEMNRIEKELKSTSTLLVMVGGENWEAMKNFINDLVLQIRAELPDLVYDVEYNARNLYDFFDKNKYLYIDYEDLKEIYRRLKQQIDYEKIKQSPFYINLEDEPPKFDISDIEEKYKKDTSNYQNHKEGYFTNSDATLAIIIVKPYKGSTNADFAEYLISRVDNVITKLNPKSYDPSLKYAFGGRYKKIVEQYRSLVGDILKSITLCVSLVGILLVAHFKRLRMGIWMIIVVLQGTLLTLAITRFKIGYLTSQTAFLGSIIVGNGIDYSIVILSRFLEERRRGQSLKDAISIALSTTWRATITSSLTTSAAFGVLAMTEVKGFSQFGIIGGIGMVMCWLMTYGFLPSWISLTERVSPLNVSKLSSIDMLSFLESTGRWVERHYAKIVKAAAIAIGISIFLAIWYLPRSLEYDFSKLKFQPKPRGGAWEIWAGDQVNSIFGQSVTPTAVLADDMAEAKEICKTIKARAEETGASDIFEKCKSFLDYVPERQAEKLEVLKDIRELLSGSTLAFLSEKQKREVLKFKKTFDLTELTIDEIPDEISANFEDVHGRRGVVAYIYSYTTANLWDGKNLIRFADLIRKIDLPSGKTVWSSGEFVIYADLLKTVAKEGPKITLISFLAVAALVVIFYLRSRTSFMMISNLSIGISLLIAIMAIFKIKLNFLNFVALPISFGIGVDYGINMYQRYILEGKGSMAHVTSTTGKAVALCSATTIIGYSVLLISSSKALQSFGMVAVIGEITCLTAAIIILPAIVHYIEKRKGKASQEKAQEKA